MVVPDTTSPVLKVGVPRLLFEASNVQLDASPVRGTMSRSTANDF